MSAPAPLPAAALYSECDPASLRFDSTAELQDLDATAFHARAVEAMHLGLDMHHQGYNLFILGDTGSGRHDILDQLLQTERRHGTPASDWCYVNNFTDASHPSLLRLPCGRGAALRDDMQRFVEALSSTINAVFQGDDYRNRVEALQEEEKQRELSALQVLGHEAAAQEIALLHTPNGFAFVPLKTSDTTLSQEEFEQLPAPRRAELEERIKVLHERLHKLVNEFPRWRQQMLERMKQLGSDALRGTVTQLLDDLKPRYADLPMVTQYLDAVLKDIVETGASLRESSHSEGEPETTTYSGSIKVQRYLVNLLVENDAQGARPIVHEDHPTLQNLVGRVEHIVHMGTLLSNFTLIRAGALQRANGGFLVLDAAKVLTQPYAWEGLKRCLKSGLVRIESLSDLIGMSSTVQLEPEPMPLDLKVVLVGERLVYYLLSQYDPDFSALFKINADLESEVERTPANTEAYARLIATLARREGLPPLTRSAMARLIEHTARLAGDAQRLSTRIQPLDDLVREAAHFTAQAGGTTIDREHVEAALHAHERRHDRVREHYLQQILRGQILVDTTGEHVGQVNGLAVVPLGGATFGHPVRITATVRVGDGEVIDIEREVKLGGPIHSKGVLILASFVASRFGNGAALSLRASLVFEQSYSGVEGDSASLAELTALLSALSGLPLRQSLAVTGSVNQFGVVQAVGGINEKIEGFFDICAARGLTGEQGVLIPASNTCHLMLRPDVVDAARAGRFHVWAVATVDDALELLTGCPAGAPSEGPQGAEPSADTVNGRILAGLKKLTQMRHALAHPAPPAAES